VLVCLFLILVVLLQPGRGGMGGAFGGGSSQTVFGSSGAGNFLTRLTSISAALFMLLSATLAFMSSSSDKSLERAQEAARAKAAAKAKSSDAESKEQAPGAAPAVGPEEGTTELPGAGDNGTGAAPTEQGVAPGEPAPNAEVPAAPAAEAPPAAPVPATP
ncbi:MAG: hypothetical protein RL385_5110, partial [Pseudomonadota bacterium]